MSTVKIRMTNLQSTRRLAIRLVGEFIFLVLANAASAENCADSFDATDQARCEERNMAASKVQLTKDLDAALASAQDGESRATIEREQAHWETTRLAKCKTLSCTQQAIWARIAELEMPAPAVSVQDDEDAGLDLIRKSLRHGHWSGTAAPGPMCENIFNRLASESQAAQAIKPVVAANSFEDPRFDHWKSNCSQDLSFNTSVICETGLGHSFPADDPSGLKGECGIWYGTPPYKWYVLPSSPGLDVENIFISGNLYGSPNISWRPPHLGLGWNISRRSSKKCSGSRDEPPLEIISTDRLSESFAGIAKFDSALYLIGIGHSMSTTWVGVRSIADGKSCHWAKAD